MKNTDDNSLIENKSPEDHESRELLRRGRIAFSVALSLASLAAILYIFRFSVPQKFQPVLLNAHTGGVSEWGQFGDFFGGILNPAIGLVTIYLILVNVSLQKKELGYALREMKNSNTALDTQNLSIEQQSLQDTFFNWLSTYRQIISSAQHDFSENRHAVGLAVYEQIYRERLASGPICGAFPKNEIGHLSDTFARSRRIENEEDVVTINSIIMNKWQGAILSYNHIMIPALKSLTGLIVWIERQPLNLMSKLKRSDYINIISCQLSNIELKMLFYHVLNTDVPLLKKLTQAGLFDDLDIYHDASLCFLKTQGLASDRA